MNTEIVLQVIADVLPLAERAYETFVQVHGRAPTLDEWKVLAREWQSPDKIEAAEKAQLAAAKPAA